MPRGSISRGINGRDDVSRERRPGWSVSLKRAAHPLRAEYRATRSTRRDRLTSTIRRARKHGRDRGGVQVPLICGNPVRQFRPLLGPRGPFVIGSDHVRQDTPGRTRRIPSHGNDPHSISSAMLTGTRSFSPRGPHGGRRSARPKTWVDAGCPKRGLGDGRCSTSPSPPPPIVHLGCRVGDDGARPQTTEVRDGSDNPARPIHSR
jgi:hypothetical protein